MRVRELCLSKLFIHPGPVRKVHTAELLAATLDLHFNECWVGLLLSLLCCPVDRDGAGKTDGVVREGVGRAFSVAW